MFFSEKYNCSLISRICRFCRSADFGEKSADFAKSADLKLLLAGCSFLRNSEKTAGRWINDCIFHYLFEGLCRSHFWVRSSFFIQLASKEALLWNLQILQILQIFENLQIYWEICRFSDCKWMILYRNCTLQIQEMSEQLYFSENKVLSLKKS